MKTPVELTAQWPGPVIDDCHIADAIHAAVMGSTDGTGTRVATDQQVERFRSSLERFMRELPEGATREDILLWMEEVPDGTP
jgi:phosphosulfolactate phosphohydrolase-like enzyme